MQATMWVILGAMVALAGVVSHYRSGGANIELGGRVRTGEISFRVPEGWVALSSDQPFILGIWTDAAAPPQTLIAYVEKLPALIQPQVYLLRSGLVQAGTKNTAQPIAMGGQQGMMISSVGSVRLPNGQLVHAVQVLASVVLPDRVAITFRLNGFYPNPDVPQGIMRQVAASLAVGTADRTHMQFPAMGMNPAAAPAVRTQADPHLGAAPQPTNLPMVRNRRNDV